MERAWENPDLWVRSKTARDPRTPQEVLERLAGDPSPMVRWGVGRNPSSPLWILEWLAEEAYLLARARLEVARARVEELNLILKLNPKPEAALD